MARAEPLTREEIAAAAAFGEWPIGDPGDAHRAVQTWVDAGADQLTFGMLSQELPVEAVIEATELFGREVIPHFDTDPVHRTTRLREEQVGSEGAPSGHGVANGIQRAP